MNNGGECVNNSEQVMRLVGWLWLVGCVLADGRPAGRFLVEHVASFDAVIQSADSSLERGQAAAGPMLMSAEEAMRRLRQLTMRRSVWTTRVTLVITGTELMIFDAETNAVMERFPLSLICRPTAMTSDVAGDVYDNVVILLVLGDPQQQFAPEVHIFQCLKHPASTTTTTAAAAAAAATLCLKKPVSQKTSPL